MIYNLFIGTYAKTDGIYECSFDSETGAFKLIGGINVENPSYLSLHKNVLYGVSETDSFNGANGGALFSVSSSDRQISKLTSIQGTNGKSPCHLCIQDNFIFISNYSEGSLSVFEINSGQVLPSCQAVAHYGSGVNPSRQKKAHVHFSGITPDNKYLAVCDLGLDKVFLYPYSIDTGISLKSGVIKCPGGSGPRHLTFSHNKEYLYVLTELHSTILIYKYNDGSTNFLGEISSLPENFDGVSYAAAIKISNCGRYLCASNRGHNSIAVFDISDGGKPVIKRFIPTGENPRDFCFSPDGKWIVSANQKGNSVEARRFDDDSETAGTSIDIPSPVCVLFERAD